MKHPGSRYPANKSILHSLVQLNEKGRRLLRAFGAGLRQRYWKLLYQQRLVIHGRCNFANTSTIVFDNSRSTITFGESLQVREYCFFRAEGNGNLQIGSHAFFNNGCSLNCLGEITIGNNCQFGEAVRMYDHNHRYKDGNRLISEQGYAVGRIVVGDNCWIGSNVVILKDVTIGDNVVIGAGCVIHQSIPAGSVVYHEQNLQLVLGQQSGVQIQNR